MKTIFLLLLPIYIFSQTSEYPDTIYTKRNLTYPCLITKLTKNNLLLTYEESKTSALWDNLRKVFLGNRGVIYREESGFLYDIDSLISIVKKRPINSLTGQLVESDSNIFKNNYFEFIIGNYYSRFRTVKSEIQSYTAIGLSYDFYLSNNLSFSPGIIFSHKGGIIRNKSSGAGFEWQFYVIQDINCKIRYIDFPLLLKYHFILPKKFEFQIFSGITLAWARDDKTDDENTTVISLDGNDDTKDWPRLDYLWNFDPGPSYINSSSTIDFTIGAGLVWYKFDMQFRYSRNIGGKVEVVKSLYINEIFEVYSLFIGFML